MKKRLILTSIFIVCIIGLVFINTYGLFETNAKATTSLAIGKWKVVLNDTDVTLLQSVSFSDFEFTGSTHTEEGYFAPGSTGVFEVELDLSNCDTAVEYNLTFDTTQFDDHPNIELNIIDEDTNQEAIDGVFHGVVGLNDLDTPKRLRIEMIWNDDPNYNENDNELIGETLNFVINSNFKQYTGE